MKKIFQYILLFPMLLFVLGSCKKTVPVEVFQHSYVLVSYKKFVSSPGVLVLVDKDTVGTVNAGSSVGRVLVTDGKPRTLTVKNTTTGAVLLDSVFTPSAQNKFEIFISDLLGINEFYKPPVTAPDAQTIRLQLFHQITYQGVQRNVNFKFFLGNGTDPFEATTYELNNVAYGQVSAFIDLPLTSRNYYVKTYDANTGELLLDLFDGFPTYGQLRDVLPGKQQVVVVVAPDDPMYGIFYDEFLWQYLFY